MLKSPNWQDSLKESLDALKEKDLYRSIEPVGSAAGAHVRIGNKDFLNFSSNNYLGLANHPKVKRAAIKAIRQWGTGSGASRLISGNLHIHGELEKRIARMKHEETALIYSSGYLANLGAVTALVGEKDLVLMDRLNHASLIDAARLSKAKLWVYPHKDAGTLDKLLHRAKDFEKILVVTDAYFSMDGDVAPLDKIFEVCEKHNAMMMVDEAHSTGVFGKNGSGLVERFGLSGKIHVAMGTLSKALGSVGGFIAGKKTLREYLINKSREFIYTTAPAPAASGAAIEAIRIIEADKSLRNDYWTNILYLRNGLTALGFDLMSSEGPIIPMLVGDTKKAVQMKEFLKKEGIFAPAIRPPTVPKGTDRIRLSVIAGHTKRDLDRLLKALEKARKISPRHLFLTIQRIGRLAAVKQVAG